jgi:hypothetical protein
MSQRPSGYARQENELYQTPSWVTETLLPHLPFVGGTCWEPACGGGWMSQVLQHAGFTVSLTDKTQGDDFLGFESAGGIASIITNPPYNQAQEFIEHALKLLEPQRGFCAFLLRVDYDSAKTRRHLFAEHPAWCKKVVLTKRIVWFEEGGKSPSFNHAWYIWNWRHTGPATLAYGG